MWIYLLINYIWKFVIEIDDDNVDANFWWAALGSFVDGKYPLKLFEKIPAFHFCTLIDKHFWLVVHVTNIYKIKHKTTV